MNWYLICKNNFYFLRADFYEKRKKIVTGKLLNSENGDGMLVPCWLKLAGQRCKIETLKQHTNEKKEVMCQNKYDMV